MPVCVGEVSPGRSSGKGFLRCPTAAVGSDISPWAGKQFLCPVVFEIAVYAPKSGQSFQNPSAFVHWMYAMLKFSGQDSSEQACSGDKVDES